MLTVRDHMTMRFQAQHWKYAGARAAAMLETFNESETRHAQRLNHLLDHPAAEAAYPQLVRRLRRIRAARQVQRSARRLDDARAMCTYAHPDA